jgi:hypothetical protein
VSLSALNDALTRGGPYMRTGREVSQEVRLNSPFGNRTGWRVSGSWSRDEFEGHREQVGGSLTLRPMPRWQVSLEPSYAAEVESRQYVTSLSGGRTATFGSRYVFAYIDRTTLSSRLRLNYAFAQLTLEGYAEPFLASGRYSRWASWRPAQVPGEYGAAARRSRGTAARSACRATAPTCSRWRTETSTSVRSVRTSCCAGSGTRAARCSWCGSRIGAPAMPSGTTCGCRPARNDAPAGDNFLSVKMTAGSP